MSTPSWNDLPPLSPIRGSPKNARTACWRSNGLTGHGYGAIGQSSLLRYSRHGPHRLPRAVPDPRVDDVPDQPFARRDAGRGGAAARAVRAGVEDARRPRVGRRLVELRVHRRRPDRLDHRGSARYDGDAPERDGGGGDRPLVLRPEAAAQQDRLRGRAVSVGALRAAGVVALRGRG